MSSETPVPSALVERLRTYFAAFLPVALVDEALESTLARFPGGAADGSLVLRAGHEELSTRLRVSRDVEALVLHDDLDLSIPTVATVLEVPEQEVRRLLDQAHAELDEHELDQHAVQPRDGAAILTPPPETAEEDASQRARARRGVAAIVSAGLIAAVLLGVFAAARQAPTCRDATEVGVTELVVTDGIGPSGAPVSDLDVLSAATPVMVWIGYEPQPHAPGAVSVRWARAGVELYETELQLSSGGQVNVTLAPAYATPGSYEVQVREGSCVIAQRRFELRG